VRTWLQNIKHKFSSSVYTRQAKSTSDSKLGRRLTLNSDTRKMRSPRMIPFVDEIIGVSRWSALLRRISQSKGTVSREYANIAFS